MRRSKATDERIETTPATLQVFRYRPGVLGIQAIIGESDAGLPEAELIAHATEALQREQFTCHAVSQPGDMEADELCFVPQGDHCEILSIRANGWQRHHGDHRRSLVEILSGLAANIACGQLRVLDDDRLAAEVAAGDEVLRLDISDTATLATARESFDRLLREAGMHDERRLRTILCFSEAVTNLLLHGGGAGSVVVRRLPDRLRVVVADSGPGLNFLNWIEPPAQSGQASMGYGFKIIMENLDGVGLHTHGQGTTLVLDRNL